MKATENSPQYYHIWKEPIKVRRDAHPVIHFASARSEGKWYALKNNMERKLITKHRTALKFLLIQILTKQTIKILQQTNRRPS